MLNLSADSDLGEHGTKTFTEVFPALGFVVGDSLVDSMLDVNTVEENVVTDMNGESLWVLEGLNDGEDLLGLSLVLWIGAGLDSSG